MVTALLFNYGKNRGFPGLIPIIIFRLIYNLYFELYIDKIVRNIYNKSV